MWQLFFKGKQNFWSSSKNFLESANSAIIMDERIEGYQMANETSTNKHMHASCIAAEASRMSSRFIVKHSCWHSVKKI
jgi:hypothetical protein